MSRAPHPEEAETIPHLSSQVKQPEAGGDTETVRATPNLSEAPPPIRESMSSMSGAPPSGDRYELRSLLGEGGMGEVHVCKDRQIGREVALKIIRRDAALRADVLARFEREARVQGQLEHPAIVPVYDLG